jgi:hypothetical protein
LDCWKEEESQFLHIRLHGLIFGYSTHPFPYATTETKRKQNSNQSRLAASIQPTNFLTGLQNNKKKNKINKLKK